MFYPFSLLPLLEPRCWESTPRLFVDDSSLGEAVSDQEGRALVEKDMEKYLYGNPVGIPKGHGQSGLRGDNQLWRALQKGPWGAVSCQEPAVFPGITGAPGNGPEGSGGQRPRVLPGFGLHVQIRFQGSKMNTAESPHHGQGTGQTKRGWELCQSKAMVHMISITISLDMNKRKTSHQWHSPDLLGI